MERLVIPALLGGFLYYLFQELLPMRRLQHCKLWAAIASIVGFLLMMLSACFLPAFSLTLQMLGLSAAYFLPVILVIRRNPGFHFSCAVYFACILVLTRQWCYLWWNDAPRHFSDIILLMIFVALGVMLKLFFSLTEEIPVTSEKVCSSHYGYPIVLFLICIAFDFLNHMISGIPDQNKAEYICFGLFLAILLLLWDLFLKDYRELPEQPLVVQYDEGLTPEMRIERRFNYYATQAKYLEEFRSFRHDYKNQLTTLKALLERGEYARAEEFLSALTVKFEDMRKNTPNYSDNMLVDAVLQHMAGRCAASHITFEASVVVGNELPLTDLDLSAVFCNIADNAFEAAEKSGASVPIVRFLSSRREKWLIVTAENSYNGVLKTDPETDELCTTKPESRCHGFGVKNIKRIVEAVPGASVRIEQLPAAEESPENGAIFRISLIFPRHLS